MKSRVKIILYIVLFVVAMALIYCVSSTYAVYETITNGTANLDIGSWLIRLNSVDISSGETISFNANNFTYSNSSHIANGVIAPGRSGYFEVIIDPDGSDVSIRYDITLDMEEDYGDNITYYVDTNNGSAIRTGESTYSGVLDLSEIENGDVATLRIVVEWLDNSAYDEHDTELGLTPNNNITIPAEITVVQYLGETIVPYVGE